MKKACLVLAFVCLALYGGSAQKEKVFILVAHPDDTLACAETQPWINCGIGTANVLKSLSEAVEAPGTR